MSVERASELRERYYVDHVEPTDGKKHGHVGLAIERSSLGFITIEIVETKQGGRTYVSKAQINETLWKELVEKIS